jgi:hypothetical protein
MAHLEIQREHVLKSAERLARTTELHAQVQARIEQSVALVERARTSNWSTTSAASYEEQQMP